MKLVVWESQDDVSLYNDYLYDDEPTLAIRTRFYAWLADTEEGQWVRANFSYHSFKMVANVDHHTYQQRVSVYIETEPSATVTEYILRFKHGIKHP